MSGTINVGGNYHEDNRSWQANIDNRGGVYAGRDMIVHAPPGLLRDLDTLDAVLASLRLTPRDRGAASAALTAARRCADTADQPGTGSHLRRFTAILTDAGAMATAGAALIDPLTRIGQWLGPVGTALLALL